MYKRIDAKPQEDICAILWADSFFRLEFGIEDEGRTKYGLKFFEGIAKINTAIVQDFNEKTPRLLHSFGAGDILSFEENLLF